MTDVNSFFAGSGDKKAYYVDVIYNYKDLDRGFQSQLNMSGMLESVQGVEVQRMNKQYVEDLITGMLKDFTDVEPSKDDVTSSTIQEQQNGQNIKTVTTIQRIRTVNEPLKKDTLWSTPMNDVITMNVKTIPDQANMAAEIYASLVNKLQDASTNVGARKRLEDIPKEHRSAHNYMKDIIMAFCTVRLNQFMRILRSEAWIASVSGVGVEKVKLAFNKLKGLSSTQNDEIMLNIHRACSKSLASMVVRKKPSVYLLDGYAPGGDGTAFERNRFKNTLRDMIYERLIIRDIVADAPSDTDAMIGYMRRILSEMYVNAFYPYIHFLYISELMDYFKKSGNFVNMRVAALSKVMFTVNMLIGFYESTQSQPTFASGESGKKATENVLVHWVGTLKNYFVKLSAVDFKSNMSLSDIIADSHELSSRVVEQSLSIDQLKERIQRVQLEIRSILTRYKQIHGQQKNAKLRYSFLIVFIFLLLIIGGTMITLDLHKQYLMYALTGIASLTVTISFVKLIMSIVAKR